MCIQGACGHSRAAERPTQCGGSSHSHTLPARFSLALALMACTSRKPGAGPSGSSGPSPAHLVSPAPPELGLTSGPPGPASPRKSHPTPLPPRSSTQINEIPLTPSRMKQISVENKQEEPEKGCGSRQMPSCLFICKQATFCSKCSHIL